MDVLVLLSDLRKQASLSHVVNILKLVAPRTMDAATAASETGTPAAALKASAILEFNVLRKKKSSVASIEAKPAMD